MKVCALRAGRVAVSKVSLVLIGGMGVHCAPSNAAHQRERLRGENDKCE